LYNGGGFSLVFSASRKFAALLVDRHEWGNRRVSAWKMGVMFDDCNSFFKGKAPGGRHP